MQKLIFIFVIFFVSCGQTEQKLEEFHENGALALVGTLLKNSIDGKWQLHGLLKTYDSTGKLISEENYLEGQLHGQYKNYFPNGKLESKGVFKMDMKMVIGNTNTKMVVFFQKLAIKHRLVFTESISLISKMEIPKW